MRRPRFLHHPADGLPAERGGGERPGLVAEDGQIHARAARQHRRATGGCAVAAAGPDEAGILRQGMVVQATRSGATATAQPSSAPASPPPSSCSAAKPVPTSGAAGVPLASIPGRPEQAVA
ncbi:hypothetical protein [Muricoccus vinaceus]|uniref:Uncharacterized protein n=1 Tax=Muricoccus vinaceus TaxID=424704 RepID=A0ABV6ISV6_9PROT